MPIPTTCPNLDPMRASLAIMHAGCCKHGDSLRAYSRFVGYLGLLFTTVEGAPTHLGNRRALTPGRAVDNVCPAFARSVISNGQVLKRHAQAVGLNELQHGIERFAFPKRILNDSISDQCQTCHKGRIRHGSNRNFLETCTREGSSIKPYTGTAVFL